MQPRTNRLTRPVIRSYFQGGLLVLACGIAPPAYAAGEQAADTDALKSAPVATILPTTSAARVKQPAPTASPSNRVSQPFATLRVGVVPRSDLRLAVGLDVTFPKFSILPRAVTRVDGDLLAPFSSGSFPDAKKSLIALTVDQVYSNRPPGRSRIYGGAGVGPYLGLSSQVGTHVGGKLFVGADFTPIVGAELGVNLIDGAPSLVTLQLRVGL